MHLSAAGRVATTRFSRATNPAQNPSNRWCKVRSAMKPDVNKVCGKIFRVGPLSRGIGKDERDLVLAQQRKKLGHKKSRMPDLNRITQRPGSINIPPDSIFQFLVMQPGQLRCLSGVLREQLETSGSVPGSIRSLVGTAIRWDRVSRAMRVHRSRKKSRAELLHRVAFSYA